MNYLMIALLALAGVVSAQHAPPVFAHRALYALQGMQTVVVNQAVQGEADLAIFGADSCAESELDHASVDSNITLARLRVSPTVNDNAVGYKLHSHNAGEYLFLTNFTTTAPCWLVIYTDTFTVRIEDPVSKAVVVPEHSSDEHDDHDHDDDGDHDHDHDHKSAAVGGDSSLLVLAAVSAAAMVMA
ncbi:hypothetical protein BASA81_012898 [Batrachochytrium salamandrivorans]|nr:hypothetical protein BASA81_012898 [Batrachochytrium salamandrivorans]